MNFTTPEGRIVAGSPGKLWDRDMDGKPLTTRAGAPRTECYFGLAIRKTDPGWPALDKTIRDTARQDMPTAWPHPDFAWKITDGDDPRYSSREGYAGCWVLNFKSGHLPKCFRDVDGQRVEIPASEVLCGYHARVAGSVAGNLNKQKPGLYLNHSMILMTTIGPVIQRSGADPDAAFGPPAGTTVPGTIKDAFLAGPPPPAPAAAEPVRYSVGGQMYTREQLLASGWTDAQVRDLPPF